MSNILNIESKKYLYDSIIKNKSFTIEKFNKLLNENPAEKYYNEIDIYELDYNKYMNLTKDFNNNLTYEICEYINDIKKLFYQNYKYHNTSVKYFIDEFNELDYHEKVTMHKRNEDINKSLYLSEKYLNMFSNTKYFNSDYYINIEKEDINFNNSRKTKKLIKEEQEQDIINDLHKQIYNIGLEKVMTLKQIIYYKRSEKLEKYSSKIKFLQDVINNYVSTYNFNDIDFDLFV
jgi:hypothetical protein